MCRLPLLHDKELTNQSPGGSGGSWRAADGEDALCLAGMYHYLSRAQPVEDAIAHLLCFMAVTKSLTVPENKGDPSRWGKNCADEIQGTKTAG